MTISTTTTKVSYSPSGSQTLYPFTFPIFAEADLVVYRETAAGVVSTLTLGADYTVSTATNPGEPIPWPSGGTVTTTSGYSDGKIVIVNEVPATQETDYTEGAEFPAESHEAALDKLTLLIQRALEAVGRSIQIAPTDSNSPVLPSATERAGLFLAFDSAGNLTTAAGSVGESLVLSAYGETLIAAADAAAARVLILSGVITTRGDLMRGSAAGIAERLALGTAGQVLRSDGSDAAWASPGWDWIADGSLSSVAALSLTDLSSAYRAYKIVLDDWIPATDGVNFQVLLSDDNGSTYKTGATDYENSFVYHPAGGSVAGSGSNGSAALILGLTLGNAEPMSGEITIHNPTDSGGRTRVHSHLSYVNSSGNFESAIGGGGRTADEDNDAIRLMFATGNIAQGNYTVYGLRAA